MAHSTPWVDAAFFERSVVDVTRDLIGRRLAVMQDGGSISGIVVEAEAYDGPNDPASHAAFKPNGGARVMWDGPGTIYVYAAYGVYPCLNIVCGPVGTPSATLIRGMAFEDELGTILGPGKVARALGVSLDDQGAPWSGERFKLSSDRLDLKIHSGPRIGINRGTDLPWRFHADLNELRERYANGDQTP